MASVSKRRWTHKGVTKETWNVRYIDAGGVHRGKAFAAKKDADRFARQVEQDLERGTLPDLQMTIGSAADAFLRSMSDRARDGRIGKTHFYRVENDIRLHILPFLKAQPMAKTNLPVLERWHKEFTAAKSLAPKTTRSIVQALKMIFDYAIKREWCFRNPATLLLAELRGHRKADPIETFTKEQVVKIALTAAMPMYRGRRPDAALRTECAVHLAACLGFRVGEILGLKRANVDLEAGFIFVRNSLSRKDGLKGPKTAAGIRDVAVPAHLVVLLRRWVDQFYVSDRRLNPTGLLFTTRQGRPVSGDENRSAWGTLLVRAGLSDDPDKPPFHFHALRHFAASWMIESGWSLPVVAGVLGHSKVDMTLSVYAHALEKRGASPVAVQALSDRLLLPSPNTQAIPNAS